MHTTALGGVRPLPAAGLTPAREVPDPVEFVGVRNSLSALDVVCRIGGVLVK